MSTDTLTGKVISHLAECGLIDPVEVSGSFTHRLQYGYPIYNVGYEKHLEPLLNFIEAIENLFTCGRQGAFDYSNMSEAMANGIESAELISKDLIKRDISITFPEKPETVAETPEITTIKESTEATAT
jgi:protoporphyrinogen oxidase